LVAGTFAAGQGSAVPSSTKSKKPSSEAVTVRFSEMQKAIEAQQDRFNNWWSRCNARLRRRKKPPMPRLRKIHRKSRTLR
jgi:hypothetical protein